MVRNFTRRMKYGRVGHTTPCQRASNIDHLLQHGESNVVLVVGQSKIVTHPVDGRVENVHPVQVSKEVRHAEDGNDPYINLLHQHRLVDVWVHFLGGEVSITELGELQLSRGNGGT